LRPIYKLQAGISVWGQGEIDGVDTDIWLSEFIKRNEKNYNSLQEFAILLQDELRMNIPDIDVNKHTLGTIGFHLAGFIDHTLWLHEMEGRHLPTFYHIHNGVILVLQSREIQMDPRRVNANHDFPPKQVRSGEFYTIRNGDFQMFALVNQQLEALFGNLRERGFRIPDYEMSDISPLKARAEYIRFWIKTISEIYKLSNIFPGIGGEVTTLTITPQGIESYETK